MKRNYLGIGVLAAAALVGTSHAQSIWSDLARKIASHPQAQAQNVTNQVVNQNRQGMAVAAPQGAPGVPNENPDGYGNRLAGQTPELASIGNTALSNLTGLVTGANGKPGGIDLGKESDDSDSMLASNLFKKPEIRRMLGDEPRFIYNPGDKPDPMLVPWVRRAAIFKELMTQADALLAAGKIADAMKLYQRVADLRDPRYTAIVQAKLATIDSQLALESQKAIAGAVQTEIKVELPGWVHDNTTGALVTPTDAVCLVGDYMLHPGEAIPSYPEVRVASITPTSVTYQVKDKQFEVSVPKEDNSSPRSK